MIKTFKEFLTESYSYINEASTFSKIGMKTNAVNWLHKIFNLKHDFEIQEAENVGNLKKIFSMVMGESKGPKGSKYSALYVGNDNLSNSGIAVFYNKTHNKFVFGKSSIKCIVWSDDKSEPHYYKFSSIKEAEKNEVVQKLYQTNLKFYKVLNKDWAGSTVLASDTVSWTDYDKKLAAAAAEWLGTFNKKKLPYVLDKIGDKIKASEKQALIMSVNDSETFYEAVEKVKKDTQKLLSNVESIESIFKQGELHFDRTTSAKNFLSNWTNGEVAAKFLIKFLVSTYYEGTNTKFGGTRDVFTYLIELVDNGDDNNVQMALAEYILKNYDKLD